MAAIAVLLHRHRIATTTTGRIPYGRPRPARWVSRPRIESVPSTWFDAELELAARLETDAESAESTEPTEIDLAAIAPIAE